MANCDQEIAKKKREVKVSHCKIMRFKTGRNVQTATSCSPLSSVEVKFSTPLCKRCFLSSLSKAASESEFRFNELSRCNRI